MLGLVKSLPGQWKQVFTACFAARPLPEDDENKYSNSLRTDTSCKEILHGLAERPEASSGAAIPEAVVSTQEPHASAPGTQRLNADGLFYTVSEVASPPADFSAATQPLPQRLALLVPREESYRYLKRSLSSIHDSLRDIPQPGSTAAAGSALFGTALSCSGAAEPSPTSTPGASPLRSAAPSKTRSCHSRNDSSSGTFRSNVDSAGCHTAVAPSTSAAAALPPLRPVSAASSLLGYEQMDVLEVATTFEALTTADLTLDVNIAGGAGLWSGGARSGRQINSASGRASAHQRLQALDQNQSMGSQGTSAAAQNGQPEVRPREPPQPAAAVGPAAGVRTAVAPTRAVLNLSQVRDHVTELRVLHIRPGAALLIGTATGTNTQVVARFERGRPAMLLAPQLLNALGGADGGRSLHHANVVSILAVHAILLPAHVLEAPSISGLPAPAAGLCFSPPLGGGAPSLTLGTAARGGAAGTPQSESPIPWLFDKDLATATLALQHAEAVRGANNGSGIIGNTVLLPSSGNVTGSARLLQAMGGPQVRLRDVVGHLRGCRLGQGLGLAIGVDLSTSRVARQRSGGAACGSDPGLQVGGHGAAAAVATAGPGFGRGTAAQTFLEPRGSMLDGQEGIDFVTLTILELCEGGNLFDEARRGSFRCCIAEPLLPPSGCDARYAAAAHSAAAGAAGPPRTGPYCAALHPAAVFSNAELVRRLDAFIATAREVAMGLHHLHVTCGLAHGDLVSRNVLLQHRPTTNPYDGRGYVAKLVGYGRLSAVPVAAPTVLPEAAPPPQSTGCLHLSATSLTRVNTIHVGLWRDVHSLAPERLLDPQAPPTFEADVYAYGMVLYEMAMGESPWVSMTPACVAVGTATGDLRVTCPQPCVLASISDLIEQCTAPRPSDRPSMDELLAALTQIDLEICAGKDTHAARQQQRDHEQLMHTFLDSSDSLW